MEDPVFKIKYQKCKYKVKVWEKVFKQKNGRVPSKHDIKDAPIAIRDAYKMYYKLKSSFLEDTLSEIFDEDGFDIPMESSQQDYSASQFLHQSTLIGTDDSFETSINDIISTDSLPSTSLSTFSNLSEINPIELINLRNTDSKHVINEFESVRIEPQNEKAWGKHLNKKVSASASSEPTSKSASQEVRRSVTEKLFRNASFTARNPRKALSRNNSQNISSLSQSSIGKEMLPDLETILIEKALRQLEADKQNEVQNLAKPVLLSMRSVDQGWLERHNDSSVLTSDPISTDFTANTSVTESQPTPRSYGLSNIDSFALEKATFLATAAAKIDRSSSSLGLSKLVLETDHIYAENTNDDDDDGVIENSEDESEKPQPGTFRHILKKRKVETSNISSTVNNLDREMSETIVSLPRLLNKDNATLQAAQPLPNIARSKQSNVLVKVAEDTGSLDVRPTVIGKNSKIQKIAKTKKTKVRNVPKRESPTRSTRVTRGKAKKVQYSENQCSGEEEDPFTADSDNDPDYEKEQDVLNNVEKSCDVPEQAAKIGKKRAAIKPTTKGKKRTSQKAVSADEDADETQKEYIVEFGTQPIQSVPRINIDELQETSKMFESFASSRPQPKMDKAKSRIPTIVEPRTKREQDREKIEKKIAAGSLNENFISINIQKKVFVRGHRKTNYSKYKKTQWSKNKAVAALAGPEMDMRGCDGGFLVCFQCGQQGHFAQNCKMQSDRLLPLSADVEVSDFPTLDEVQQMAIDGAKHAHGNRIKTLPSTSNKIQQLNQSDEVEINGSDETTVMTNQPVSAPEAKRHFIGHEIPEEFLKKAGLFEPSVSDSNSFQPLYELSSSGECIDTTAEVMDALRLFGHTSFRKGQDRAVMRVLSGMSTLVTLSTGSGKSLCYQLPAYLYRQKRNCITLVISPLVSLMEDQVNDVPSFLNAQCLHTNQTKQLREKIMEMIKSGIVDVLLVSPEAIVAGEKSSGGFGSLLRKLPPIAFVCIDEAHCMSQWSHNFRPSYLMICRVLKEQLKVRTVLGLTATATIPTRESIVRHLSIPDGLYGVISDIPLPNNLLLTVSKDENRDAALVQLLKHDTFTSFQSIIVYCTRRDVCERVANYIRTCFQAEELRMANEAAEGQPSRKRKRVKHIVEFYHAGMAASRRKKIQNDFMRGDLKIVVATIAFGMGINKADIRAVIHYNMPMTFESYVQEVGRAGRDGKHSQCHLFLEKQGSDLVELRRHVYANSIDRHVIRKLLRKVFVPCACASNETNGEIQSEIDAAQSMDWSDNMDEATNKPKKRSRKCPGHEVGFSIDDLVQELDIPEENIATLLCYLELHEERYIQVLSKAYCMCKVSSYNGPNGLKLAARTCPPLAMAIALDIKKGKSHDESTFIEFHVIDIASSIGWDSGVVKYHLKNLEWTAVNGIPKRSTLSVEFTDLGFRVKSPGDLLDEELDATLDLLHTRSETQEKTQLIQLQTVCNSMESIAFNTFHAVFQNSEQATERSEKLKHLIRAYFQRGEMDTMVEVEDTAANTEMPEAQIINDVRTMLARYPENNFTGRALARIFHGVASPVYPAQIWSRCKYWRQLTKIDFNRIVRLANLEIVKIRT